MRMLNYACLSFFVVAGILQHNDPDPYVWVPLYGFAAFLSYQMAKGNISWAQRARNFSLLYSVGGIAWFFAHRAELFTGNREPLWESMGLALTGFLLGVQMLVCLRFPQTKAA